MKMSETKRFVYVTMLCAMAISLNLFESIYIGNIFPFGIRIGLANIIALITIEMFGIKEMLVVNVMRVFIGNLIRGLIFGSTFWIALGGVVLSSIALIITHKLKSSLIFSSVVCSVMHSLGQVLVVIMFYNQPRMIAIMPYLLLGSIPMGVITGIVSKNALRLMKKI
ncbi:MAG TPA: heptaprenyl diphosphate synthase [Erysipelotrichaceae bacterium]|jgi:heptaprenyl diphosphate synthase|nr:heptaprenyl diphosphate synthase [Erysipelotrichaceae bacterium]